MDSKPFDIGDYHSEGKCIGSGSFGAVYLGYHRSHPSRQVAIKMMNLRRLMPNNNDEKAYARLAAEIQIQQECDSPYTVRLFQVLSQDGFLYLIMELCWGDLQKLLNENGGKFSEPVCRRLMGHLVRGLRMLRERSIVHRDLKPQNLMISFPDPSNPDPATAELKLADFGFARVLGEAETAETLCGSPLYMAPEILTTMRYDAQADLYSAGSILFHMLAGHAPYPVRSLAEILHIHRTHGAIPVVFPEEMLRNVSPSAISLLEGLLKKQPTDRISLAEVLVHPWLQLDSDPSPSPSPAHPGTPSSSSGSSVSDSAALTPAEVLQAFQKMESFLPKGYGQPLFESIASLADENLLDTFVSRVLHLVQESREPAELAPPAHISQTLSDLHDEIDRSRKEIEELRERAQRTRIITADLRVGDRAMFYSDKGTYVAYGKHNPRPVLDATSKTRFQDKIASQLVVIGVVEAITEVSGGPGKPPSLLVTLRKA